MLVGPTDVSPIPALVTLRPLNSTWTATATVAKSPTLRSSLLYAPPAGPEGTGIRISITISFGFNVVVYGSWKKPPPRLTRSPQPDRPTSSAPTATITTPHSP